MIEIILSQLGLSKEEVAGYGRNLVAGVNRIDQRLARLEAAAGLDPLPEDGDETEAQNGGIEYDDEGE